MSEHDTPTPPRSDNEIVPPSDLYAIYQAMLSPQGDYVQRLKDVQAAAGLYDSDRPGSGARLEQLFSALIKKPVRLSKVQLDCFKEIFVNDPKFAHIAPWNHPANIW